MNTGNKIRRLREMQGLSQSQLAVRADVSQSSIHYIESNQNSPTQKTLRKIATALGVTLAELLDDSADETCATLEKVG